MKEKEFASKFHKAAAKGFFKEVQRFIDRKSDLNQKGDDGWTPLHCACKYGQLEVVKFLLKNGSEIDEYTLDKRTPFIIAAEHGHTQIMLHLLQQNAIIDSEDASIALHLAAHNDQQQSIRLLSTLGSDIYTKNKQGETPLRNAFSSGNVKAASILVNLYKKLDQVRGFFVEEFDPTQPMQITDLHNFFMLH